MMKKLRLRLLPAGRVIELDAHPNESIEKIRNRLITEYGIERPEIRMRRGDIVVAIPSDAKVEDIPEDVILEVSSYTDVGVRRARFEDEARILKEYFGWIKIGDTRILYPYAKTYDGLPLAIYIKKSPNFPDEPPIVYLIPLSKFDVKKHIKLKPECCFDRALPEDELNLIRLYLYKYEIYPQGICWAHIAEWDSRVTNPIASTINILEVRFGLKNIRYA